jgi:hypothetical protein
LVSPNIPIYAVELVARNVSISTVELVAPNVSICCRTCCALCIDIYCWTGCAQCIDIYCRNGCTLWTGCAQCIDISFSTFRLPYKPPIHFYTTLQCTSASPSTNELRMQWFVRIRALTGAFCISSLFKPPKITSISLTLQRVRFH